MLLIDTLQLSAGFRDLNRMPIKYESTAGAKTVR